MFDHRPILPQDLGDLTSLSLITARANLLIGQWEFVQKGEAPMVGLTKLDGITLEELKRPRRKVAPPELLEASSPTSVTEPGSKAEASRP